MKKFIASLLNIPEQDVFYNQNQNLRAAINANISRRMLDGNSPHHCAIANRLRCVRAYKCPWKYKRLNDVPDREYYNRFDFHLTSKTL